MVNLIRAGCLVTQCLNVFGHIVKKLDSIYKITSFLMRMETGGSVLILVNSYSLSPYPSSSNYFTPSFSRASVFSPTPTGNMSAVVGVAKSLYDQLSCMGEDSIDGDSFLDLWIYVTLKAYIPELVSGSGSVCVCSTNSYIVVGEWGYWKTTLHQLII